MAVPDTADPVITSPRRRAGVGVRRPAPEAVVTGAVVVACMAFVAAHLHPSLLVADTTPAGGDMGAHVWGPAYLRDHLLGQGRLSGWTPDWYAGFPAYHFYMVVPSLFILALDVVLPYNVAFKLVSVAGLLALPVAAWALGRLGRLPFPGPALLAVGAVTFLFDRSFTIYGGNIASTLAGEFAFSLSLAFALVFVGVVLRGLDTGRYRVAAAVLLALTALCHIIPAIFAVAAGVVALLLRTRPDRARWVLAVVAVAAVLAAVGVLPALGAAALVVAAWLVLGVRRRPLWWGLPAGVVGGLLTAFWTVPFVLRRPYLNDMGWERLEVFWERLLPGLLGETFSSWGGGLANNGGGEEIVGDITAAFLLAVVGVVASFLGRRRLGVFLTATAAVAAVGYLVAPQGRLWNARLLPFWYLCIYLLAAIGAAELVRLAARSFAERGSGAHRATLATGALAVLVLGLFPVALVHRTLPFGEVQADGSYRWPAWGPGVSTTERGFVRDWAKWNYEGYERKPSHPEFRDVVDTMGRIGREEGCGRAMWEYDPSLDRFGTPMALMLLPYFTDGCIGSMEGLYFEASATTPYHFLNQSLLSANPSRAQRDLPYGALDIARGVDHLQLLGVRYYLAFSDAAVAQAEAEPRLALVDTTLTWPVADATGSTVDTTWRVYEVADAPLVEPLAREPAVVTGMPEGGEPWLDLAVDWYTSSTTDDVVLAAAGPDDWQRVSRRDEPEAVPVPPVEVRRIEEGADTISFEVSEPGSPVLVKTSYFPNWKASGADGPWRVTPNLMVVVPTAERVELHYGTTWVEWLAWALTLAGVVGLVLLWRGGRVDVDSPGGAADPDADPDPDRPEDDGNGSAAVSDPSTTGQSDDQAGAAAGGP